MLSKDIDNHAIGDTRSGTCIMMKKPGLIAFLLSFLIYILPVFTVHAGLLPWPIMFLSDLSDGSSMAFAALAGALIVQGIAWFVFLVLLRGMRWWKLLTIGAFIPILFIAVNFTFLYAVPALVLIAPDWSEDVGELKQACFAADVSLMQVNTGVSLSLAKSGKAWVRDHHLTGAAILSMPGCKVEKVADFTRGDYRSVNVAGEVLFETYKQVHLYSKAGSASSHELISPADTRNWHPILTTRGGQLAWLDRAATGNQGKPHLIRLRDIDDPTQQQTIEVDVPPRASLSLMEADPPYFTIARNLDEIIVVNADGKVVWGPILPPGVENAVWGFRRIGSDGWVAWDGYRDKGQRRLVWSLEDGKGEIIMPRGRKIESAAVSPDGRHIAYATEANSYFHAEGRLVVLRTTDGSIAYRRRLPQFARLQLSFLGNDHLAFRNYADGPKGTAVYRIAE